MSACPSCGQAVRPFWPSCRACGTLLMARPEPLAKVGTADSERVGPSPEEQFFAPAVLQPMVQLPPARPERATSGRVAGGPSVGGDAGKWIVLFGMVLVFIGAIATAWFTLGAAKSGAQTPVVLAPRPATAGLPSGLDTVVRMEAESARRTALQTAEQTGNADVAQLSRAQPNFAWVSGDRPSTDSYTVSVGDAGGAVTVAVAASNHDVCAFGRWSNGSTPVYVTMGHESTCAAVNAPPSGWTTEPGGAASDLPDDNA